MYNMNKKLQHVVATQFEAAGFKTHSAEIRGANGVSGVRKIAVQVIKKLAALDPEGFGSAVHKATAKGENNNE